MQKLENEIILGWLFQIRSLQTSESPPAAIVFGVGCTLVLHRAAVISLIDIMHA